MTLVPSRGPRRDARIITWDLEWHPETCALRLAGAYELTPEGEDVRQYTSISEFLRGELIPDNAGAWFYAHAGGLYDIEYLIDEIINRGQGTYQVTGTFSGSSAVIVVISDGSHRWTFVDSFWTLRDSLAKIGASVGMPKGECSFTAPLAELAEYNIQDCRILWHAMSRFQSEVRELGGCLRKTIASTALELIRRAYLKRPIETNRRVNETLRDSYIGGRVEVFGNYASAGYVYDINSSFPAAMAAGPLPGRLTRQYLKRDARSSPTYFANVTIHVPDTIYAPPLPYRSDGSIYYPAGTWQAWFAGVELEYAESLGVEIREWHECYDFEPRDDLQAFATDLYSRRAKETDDFRRMTYKLLMNSGYGKFGESRQKESLAIFPDAATLMRYPRRTEVEQTLGGKPRGNWRRLLMPGVWILAEDKYVPHEHIPIAAWITARARVQLHRPLQACIDRGAAVWYCDTDSIATSDPALPTGDGLGALKLEKSFQIAHFVAPKLYRLDDKIRAKGFGRSREKPFGPAEFAQVLSGATYERPAMPRIRRLLTGASTAPHLETQRRSVHLDWTRPKRAPVGDPDRPGESRPWYVSELGRSWSPASRRASVRLPARARVASMLLERVPHTPEDVRAVTALLRGARTWADVADRLPEVRARPGLATVALPECGLAAQIEGWTRAGEDESTDAPALAPT